MDDKLLVRVIHCLAQRHKEPEFVFNRKRALVAETVDGHAIDQFHDKIGDSVAARTAVEQPSDIRVIEPRENLTFARKSNDGAPMPNSAVENLDCDSLRNLAVDTLGSKDRAHSASADLLTGDEWPESLAHASGGAGRAADNRAQKTVGTRFRRKQFPQLSANFFRSLDAIKVLLPLRWRKVEYLTEKVAQNLLIDRFASHRDQKYSQF